MQTLKNDEDETLTISNQRRCTFTCGFMLRYCAYMWIEAAQTVGWTRAERKKREQPKSLKKPSVTDRVGPTNLETRRNACQRLKIFVTFDMKSNLVSVPLARIFFGMAVVFRQIGSDRMTFYRRRKKKVSHIFRVKCRVNIVSPKRTPPRPAATLPAELVSSFFRVHVT